MSIVSANANPTTATRGKVSSVRVRGYRYKYTGKRATSPTVLVTGVDEAAHRAGILEYLDDEEAAAKVVARMSKDKKIHHVQIVRVPDSGVKVIGR